MNGRALVVVAAWTGWLAGCGQHAPATPPVAAPVAAPPDAAVAPISDAAPADDLGFGAAGSDGLPAGWGGGPPGTLTVDEQVRHDGHRSIRVARTSTSPDVFSAVRTMAALQVAGSTIELRGFLRTQDVKGVAGLWVREDGDAGMLALDNMANHPVTGTTEWTAYTATLPLNPEATTLVWGALLQGEGTAWVADLQIFVDGKPIAQAPPAVHAVTPLERDHEFDHGSHLTTGKPTAVQLANLVTLAKVWGFLKYHHPAITAGKRHWDYDLLRTLPAILAAPDRASANAALVAWIRSLGDVAPCKPCAKLPADVETKPDLAWLDDRAKLGTELATALRAIYDNRVVGQQFYVSLVFGVGNPQLHHEPSYDAVTLPDVGFQLLALFRLWNVIEYWAPDRALADPWDRVLADAIPEVMAATSPKAYLRAIQAVIARVHDGHAGLPNAVARPPDGDCRLPDELQFIGRRLVVRRGGSAGGLAVGDEITAVGGVAVDKLVASWTPYYSASNEPARLRDIARLLTRGDCGAVAVDARRAAQTLHLSLVRDHSQPGFPFHDQPGPTFRLLSPDVGYLKLSSVIARDSAHYIAQAAGTKGLVIDIRNYPSDFVVFALGSLLVDEATPFAAFTNGDLSNPGAFVWADPISLEPAQPHYAGKVVVLVDEVSQSQAEYTAMAFRAAHAVVVGSTTAGVDGNITTIALPGTSTPFSGIGVFYPGRKPTQGVGIVADVKATPTIAGIAAGRDEVLEAGIRQIVGASLGAAQIEKMARPPAGSGAP